jgi:hypothetical protein
LWFLGSWAMGNLYGYSIAAVVILGVACQFAAAVMFLTLRRPLAAARQHH